jgi:6-phosphogluconolactonase
VVPLAHGEVHVFRDEDEFSRAAASLFVDVAVAAVRGHGRFAVALSGGSTPKKLYSLLAQPEFSRRTPWDDVHLFWGDERCVPPDHAESNYGMVEEVLLRHLTIPRGNVHRIRGEAPPEQAAAEYDVALRAFFGLAGEAWPRFDLVLLGLGEDGHTASLFPGSPALAEMARLAVASRVMGAGTADRVSLTLPVIDHAAVVAFLVAGERKRSAVARVVRHPDDHGGLPAQRVRPSDGQLLWLLDEAAAAGIRP